MDRFSPVAAAHIRVLVLPVGRIERKSFVDFVRRLQDEAAVIHHADLKAHVAEGDDFLLSPRNFEQGCVLFNFTSSSPHEGLLQLSPYELFREPLLVIGVVEGLDGDNEQRRKELREATAYLREKHPRVVHRHLLVLQESEDDITAHLDNAIRVENVNDAGHPALRHAISLLAIRFLRELTTYSQAMQASPSIPTPGQTSRAIQRTSWLRDADHARSGSASGYATPREPRSPIEEDSPSSRPPPRSRDSPATSFDQIPSANNTNALSRTESNRGRDGRGGSRDRVPVQGFGTGTSQEKMKKRGKARVGIVLGSIYMMAGMWSESLQLLVEHTNQARSLQDHLWHAKGLENIVVCLLLHSLAGLDFQMPSICFATDKKSNPAQRFSVTLPSDPKSGGPTNQVALQRFSSSIPDIIKQLSGLYQSTEGPMELASLIVCEVTIRLTKLLAILHSTKGVLDELALSQMIECRNTKDDARSGSASSAANTASAQGTLLTRSSISDMVATALPTSEDHYSFPDHVTILAGIASVYALLGMERKKASTLRDLVSRLTHALNQARKLGAAEMGIHPAAALSAENGADALVASIHESEGMINMIADLANIYGVELIGVDKTDSSEDAAKSQKPYRRVKAFGGDDMKFEALRDLLALCEASPDPYGILRLIASFLASAGPNAAMDRTAEDCGVSIERDEQARLASLMNKTIGVSRQLGLADAQADYWDPFLLRAVKIVTPSATHALLDRSKLKGGSVRASQQVSTNPLLYDPNASRQPTAQQSVVIVAGEPTECLLTLQNPYDLAIDVESLSLVCDGVKLETKSQPIQLGAARLQQVSISAVAGSAGKTEIKGCRIKIAGCRERFFPIASKPWSAQASMTVKSIGQDGRGPNEDPKHKPTEPEYATVSAEVIPTLPSLVVESTSLQESSLMVLEGEKQSFSVTIKNTSDVSAALLDVVGSAEGLSTVASPMPTIPPRGTVAIPLVLQGQAGSSTMRIDFFYTSPHPAEIDADADTPSSFARMLSIPLTLTVNAALQPLHTSLSSSPTDPSKLDLSFDLRNAWPEPLTFTCSTLAADDSWDTRPSQTLPPAQIVRVHLTLQRWMDSIPNPPPSAEELKAQLFTRISIVYSTPATQRKRIGQMPLDTLTLPAEATTLLLGPEVEVSLSSPSEALTPGSSAILRASLRNRTSSRTSPLSLRLHHRAQNSDAAQPAVVGALQRTLAPLAVGEVKQVEMAVWVLRKGEVRLSASVGAVKVAGSRKSDAQQVAKLGESAEVTLKVR